MEEQKVFDRLVEARRRIDAPGLLLAQREGRLLEYLADDMKKAGIDPKSVKLPELPRARRARPANSPVDIFELVSNYADEIFEQQFNESTQGLERTFYDQMTNLEPFQQIDRILKKMKVTCVIATPVLILLSLGNFAGASPARGTLFGVLAADSLRVAYNCYTKNYIAKSMKSFGGDGELTKLGSTLLQWASSSLGLSKGDDQLSRFKKGILWEIVFDSTICYTVVKKVKEIFAK